MAEFEIRDATDDDVPGVLRVFADAGIDRGESFTVAAARAHYARIRSWPNFRLLAAVTAGEVVGTYSLVIMDKLGKRGAPAGVVEDVAVSPAHKGQGIGRAMMAHALEQCRQARCCQLPQSSNL